MGYLNPISFRCGNHTNTIHFNPTPGWCQKKQNSYLRLTYFQPDLKKVETSQKSAKKTVFSDYAQIWFNWHHGIN